MTETYPFSIPSGVAISGTFILNGTDLYPFNSGTQSVGTTTHPFSGVHSNQYATPLFSQVGTTGVNINWNNGTTQVIDYTGVASGTSTVSLFNGIPGSSYAVKTINNQSGTVAVAWGGSNIIWSAAATGTFTNTNAAVDLFCFLYDGNKYLANATNHFA